MAKMSSGWASASKPLRYIPQKLGVRSVIGQTMLGTLLGMSALYAFMPDTYDKITEWTETTGDWMSDKLNFGG